MSFNIKTVKYAFLYKNSYWQDAATSTNKHISAFHNNSDGIFMLLGHLKQGSVLVKVIKRPWKADKLSPILKTYSFKVTEEEMVGIR